jgi:tetratricopeptide (TPR) repeat protein
MFEKCVQLADTISRAWFELGLFYGGQNKNKDMMRAFEKFITIETRNADAILRVGEYLLVTKNMPADAMMFLEMSNALKPNDPKVMSLLARGYMKTGRTDEGVKLLEQVVRSTRGAPVDIEIRITLGDSYLNLGRNMEAASEWKVVTDQKREPQYLIKYATALVAINNTSQAVVIANEILAKQPENIEAVMLSGRIKMAQRNYEDAMETFKKVGYINPNYAPALYERAQIFMIQQNYDWAKTFYERALKLDGRYALAELGMARVAKAQRNEAEYRKRLDRARSLDPGNKDIQDELKRAGGGR